jgi:hypothetical protein
MQQCHCETCNKPFPEVANFCAYCGTEVDRSTASAFESFDRSGAIEDSGYVLPDVPTERVSWSDELTPATKIASVAAPATPANPQFHGTPRAARPKRQSGPRPKTRRRKAPSSGSGGDGAAVFIFGIIALVFVLGILSQSKTAPTPAPTPAATPPPVQEPVNYRGMDPNPDRPVLHHCRDCKGTGKKLISGPVDPIGNGCESCAGLGYIRPSK